MKSVLPIVVGAGILAVVLSSSKKSSSKSSGTSGTGSGGLKIPAEKVPTPKTTQKPVGGLKGVGGTEPKECDLLTEYYDPQTKTCVQFWKKGETDEAVAQKINELVKELGNVELCEDPDPETPNPYATDIIKNTIKDLWGIPKDMLPPTENSPSWVFTVWNKVVDVYYAKICNL